MGARSYYVYILASRIGGTLYIGVPMTSFGACTSTKRAPRKDLPKTTT
jgi:predicted GIY-YIG superfamily endonuclease